MTTWRVYVQGDPDKLGQMARALNGSPSSIGQEEERYYLQFDSSLKIDDASDAKKRAVEVVQYFNGSARLVLGGTFVGIEVVGVVAYVLPDGSRGVTVFAPSADAGYVALPPTVAWTDAEGRLHISTPTEDVGSTIEKAQRDPLVADILRWYGQDGDLKWDVLYKVFETIVHDVGQQLPEGWRRRQEVAGKGWVSKAELDLFADTANSRAALGDESRHAFDKDVRRIPANPMSLPTARRVIERLIHGWIQSK